MQTASRRISLLLCLTALAACSSARSVPVPQSVLTQSIAGGSNITTPAAGGMSGTLSLASSGHVAVETVAAPIGRNVQSVNGGPVAIYSFTFTSPETSTLDSIPLLRLTLANAPPAGDQLYVKITDATGTTLATDGPATVSNLTAVFPLVSTPFVLAANRQYTISVYQLLPDQSLLYVANADNSIDVFSRIASGNVAPLRRIAGSSTGLNDVSSIAVDPTTGNLWALNRGGTTASITAYAAGADGDVTPIHSYALPALLTQGPTYGPWGAALTISANGADVVVAGQENVTGSELDDVWTYSTSSGALLRSALPADFSATQPGPVTSVYGAVTVEGVGVTPAGNIIIGGFFTSHDDFSNNLTIIIAQSASSASSSDFVPSLASELTPYGNGFCLSAFSYGDGSYAYAPSSNDCSVGPAMYYYSSYGGNHQTRLLTGANTQLTLQTAGLAVASNGSVFVADAAGSVSAFAYYQNGNAAPLRRISGALTQLSRPTAISVYGDETSF